MRPTFPSRQFSHAVLRRTVGVVLLVLALASPDLKAAEHWICLTTPHFQMYTTNNEKQATAALKVFEQVRYFFLQSSLSKSAPDAQVRIIAFRSEKEFNPYRLNEGAVAYYLRGHTADYIVMQDISGQRHEAAIHEYTHLVVEHVGLNLPLWLNEGLADLYSSLEAKGEQAVVGRPLEGRLQILLTQHWLDLTTLFAVDVQSPYYNERTKMSIFYAQSWALAHMLELGPKYRNDFNRFLVATASGRSAADCFQSVYGKTLADVAQDLQAYVHQSSVQGAVFDVHLPDSDVAPQVSEPSDFAVDLTLAELLASRKQTLAEGSARLSALVGTHPENIELQESLGFAAWDQGDAAKAKERLKLAIDKGSRNPQALFLYAQLLHESGTPADEIIPVLQRVVALKPDYADAWFNLGATAVNESEFVLALDAFSHIKQVTPERAYWLLSQQAYCYLRLDQPANARPLLERARKYAKTTEQQQQLEDISRELDGLAAHSTVPPTQP
jgi:tetratricopeptide (TPR) repeat protein